MNPRLSFNSRARRRLVATIAVVLGFSLPTSSTLAETIAPEAAPQAWVAYAETVSGKVSEWIRSDEESAVRLRVYIDSLRPAAEPSSPPIPLQLWVNGGGVVTRVEHPPFTEGTANTDLRNLLLGRVVGTRPPRGMLLPLRLAVQLEAVAEAAPEN